MAADRELEKCVADTGAKKESKQMFYGVRVGGGAHWPTSYHWGYGWKQMHGYKRLTPPELVLTEEVWKEQNHTLAGLPGFLVDVE